MTYREMTLLELADGLRRKEFTATELVNDTIQTIDRVEDRVGAFITRTDELAKETALAVDRKIAAGEKLPLLAGIPGALKDNIATQGIRTTTASRMLENFVPPYSAFIWKQLQKQDVPLVGKTNLDEFAMGPSTEHSAFLTTHNPHNLDYIPGGSSGGSAAAVAGAEAIFALGTDTGGSIRQPAAFCGVVGMRPSYGRVSRYGITAFASSCDQAGPITRTIRDNFVVLEAISAHDNQDSASVDQPLGLRLADIDKKPEKLHLAVAKEFLDDSLQPEIQQAILDTIKFYEQNGATVEYIKLETLEAALAAYYILTSAEASSNLSRFDGIHYGYRSPQANNLAEIYLKSRSEAFGSEVKRRILLGNFALSKDFYKNYFEKAQRVRTKVIREFADVFSKHDLILAPVAPTTAWKIGNSPKDLVELYRADLFTVPTALAGLPAISFPVGKDKKDLPIGLQLIAKPFAEGLLYRAAALYEDSHTPAFQLPEVLHE